MSPVEHTRPSGLGTRPPRILSSLGALRTRRTPGCDAAHSGASRDWIGPGPPGVAARMNRCFAAGTRRLQRTCTRWASSCGKWARGTGRGKGLASIRSPCVCPSNRFEHSAALLPDCSHIHHPAHEAERGTAHRFGPLQNRPPIDRDLLISRRAFSEPYIRLIESCWSARFPA